MPADPQNLQIRLQRLERAHESDQPRLLVGFAAPCIRARLHAEGSPAVIRAAAEDAVAVDERDRRPHPDSGAPAPLAVDTQLRSGCQQDHLWTAGRRPWSSPRRTTTGRDGRVGLQPRPRAARGRPARSCGTATRTAPGPVYRSRRKRGSEPSGNASTSVRIPAPGHASVATADQPSPRGAEPQQRLGRVMEGPPLDADQRHQASPRAPGNRRSRRYHGTRSSACPSSGSPALDQDA